MLSAGQNFMFASVLIVQDGLNFQMYFAKVSNPSPKTYSSISLGQELIQQKSKKVSQEIITQRISGC
jgi:bifunctional DNase/RNase